MTNKKVSVKVITDVEDNEVEALEKKVQGLKRTKLHQKLELDTAALDEANKKIKGLKIFLDQVKNGGTFPVNIDDSDIKKAEAELEKLEQNMINLEINVETGKLAAAKEMEESLNDTANVDISVNDDGLEAAQDRIDGLGTKLAGLVGTIGMVDQVTKMWDASTQRQFQSFYLGANIGTKEASKMQKQIQDIVSAVPGDDTFMNQLLTTSLAQNVNMTTDELKRMANVAADYMAGSKMMGKMNLESQQDVYKYLLDGNTAELERGSILSSQVDKLKDKKTIQERINALSEAETAMGYAGISGYDTAANNLEEFMGNLEKSRADLGDVFLPLEQGALKAALAINDNLSGGLTFALAGLELAAPTAVAGLVGIGEAARGLTALRDGAKWFKELGAVQKVYKAITSALIPTQIAEGAAGWFSIGWIALAIALGIALGIALIYLYNNCDWFREAVDNLGQALQWLAGTIFNAVTNAINWVSGLFQQFTSQLGLNTNDWKQGVLGFILFLPTLPLQLGVALVNALAKAVGFKGNFVQTLISTAVNAVKGFANAIMGIYTALKNCLNWAYNLIMNHPIVQAIIWLGEKLAWGFSALGLGQHSPGKIVKAMNNELDWTEKAIKNSNLIDTTSTLGEDISNNFNPNLRVANDVNKNGVSQVNNFYFNDVVIDDDKRMEKIMDGITRRLSWNNKTAGRTV